MDPACPPRPRHLRPASHRPLPRLRHLLGHPGGQPYRLHRQVGDRPPDGLVPRTGSCPWQAAHHRGRSGRAVPERPRAAGRQHLPGHESFTVRFRRRRQRVSAPQLRQEQRGLPGYPRQHHPHRLVGERRHREGEGQRRRLSPPDSLQAHREGSGRRQAGRCPHRAAACGPRLCG